jgi:hypothetical protein
VTKPLLVTLAVLLPMLALDLFLGRDIPGFYALYGFVSCIVIVVVSKWLGKHWLQRAEGYYEEGES